MRTLISFCIVSLALTACSEKPQEQKSPTNVVVEKVRIENYQRHYQYVGKIQAVNKVAIQAQVSGYITERSFKEGEMVEKDQVLYKIDPQPFKAKLAKAKADIESAKASVQVTASNFKRAQRLIKSGTISQSQYDEIEAKKLDANAQLASAQARLESAQVDLNYTEIKAPFTGLIGAKQFSVGDLVGPNSGPLTSLVTIDPIQVAFKVDEKTYFKANKKHQENPSNTKIKVSIKLPDDSIYQHTGHIDFVDNHIDANTGTISVRATVANPDGVLLDGQYVSVVLSTNHKEETPIISQAALQADQQGDFVLVVDDANKVQRKNIEQGERNDTDVFIVKGLAKDDRVIVKGLQKVRPGQEVEASLNKATDKNTEKQ